MSAEAITLSLLVVFALLLVANGLIRRPRGEGSLSDEVWPLEARSVLTDREQAFYQRLVAACPDYIVLAQVALSQLIEVRAGTANAWAIRNRFSQLVADFVICRKDFTAVAVVELDDSSHAREDRMDADRRKTKAVESAGLRLIRIPAGPLPSQAELLAILQIGSAPSSSFASIPFSSTPPELNRTSGVVINALLNIVGIGVVLVGAWVVYTRAVASLPKVPTPARIAAAPVAKVTPPVRGPAAVDPAAIQAAEQKRQEAARALAAQQAADDLEKRKQAAWAEFYKAPASCEHPPAWQDQVECGNQYIRAKRDFEKLWAVQNGLPVPQ